MENQNSVVSATLRIKKKYFDLIQSGEKTIEYRSVKPFYKFLENPDLRVLMLHYQGPERIYLEVKKVEVIDLPEELRFSQIPFTEKVYAIHLGRLLKDWWKD